MKRTLSGAALLFGAAVFLLPCGAAAKQKQEKTPKWKIVWQDDFNKDGFLDPAKWSKIPRGTAEWNNYMSSRDDLYEVKDGNLILHGIVNDRRDQDTARYLTGGVWTKNKFAVKYGKIEIRARLGEARGAWPAFWMLSQDEKYGRYPRNGEVDIMEHLNYDTIAYQTIHSYYTLKLKQDTPQRYTTVPIGRGGYNTYGVEFYPDKIVFTLNGQPTLTYPKIETELEGQFPFDQAYYLLLDMQLGGGWVGGVDPATLPVKMEIDWVKVWKRE
ncbi:glycoside hydrolase family 16 protein [uncultured Rikenella sp.]|uniref:glycoside hydrolase family 16 protein n=1 Tax=uncultured Rikenella sp. TaxID=368003 RepID=UPI00261683DF|nr:glycoside hydrolase family 16 protein [uncultured Rikenella sp.]